mgnify:CR=1 FL=1
MLTRQHELLWVDHLPGVHGILTPGQGLLALHLLGFLACALREECP